MPLADRTASEHEPPSRLGFRFRLSGGSGTLTLAAQTFFGWLRIDELELHVPNLRLPVDLAAGPEAFQRHRTRAHSAVLRVGPNDLQQLVELRFDKVEDLGVESLVLKLREGYVSMNARVRESGQAAELSARLCVDSDGRMLRVVAGRTLVYGFLPTPAPVVAHQILTALARGTRSHSGLTGPLTTTGDGRRTVIDEPPITAAGTGVGTSSGTQTGRYELDRESSSGPWNDGICGLAELALDPLDLALWHILPCAGWRLPDTRALVVDQVQITPEHMKLGYRAGTGEPAHDRRQGDVFQLFDAVERLRDPDARLLSGDIEGAMRIYRSRLASGVDDEALLLERLLAVGSSQRELFDECSELAARALARWPDFAPAQAAMASIAVARGDGVGAGARYRALSRAAGTAGDIECATRAALVGARYLRRNAPRESTALFERVLELEPDNRAATEALADRYSQEERWPDLVRLLRMRAGSTDDVRRQARDHTRVAQILCTELGDIEAARSELEMAMRLDPNSASAHEVSGTILYLDEQLQAAADAMHRAAQLFTEKRDRRSQSRTMLRAAAIHEQLGNADQAEGIYRSVLQLSPGEPSALRGAARAAGRRGDHRDAAQLWRSLVALSAGSPNDAARDSLELARSLLAGARGKTEQTAAKEALRRAASSDSADVSADAHELLAELAATENRPGDRLHHLDRAVSSLTAQLDAQSSDEHGIGNRAAELAVQRAGLLSERGQLDAAASEYERAFHLASPDHPTRMTAARYLRVAAARTSEPDAERRWLTRELATMSDPDERGALLVRRAELCLESRIELSSALADVDRALEQNLPGGLQGRALHLRAEILGALGDAGGRARALDRAIEAAQDILAQVELGVSAARARLDASEASGALERARAAARALDRLPNEETLPEQLRRRVLEALGDAAWRARSWRDVENAYTPLVDEPSEHRSEWAHRLATAHESMGNSDAAARAFELVIADEHTSGELRATTWRSLASLYEHTADLGRAAAAHEACAGDSRAQLGDAARAEAWYRAGDLYRKAGGKEDDARRCLERALQLVPDHLPSLDVLERLERDCGDFERVAVILGRKIAATPRHPGSQKSLLVRLASLQEERLARPDIAREIYRRALAIDPDYRPALRFAARDAESTGAIDEAMAAYQRLASTLPSDTELGGSAETLPIERAQAALTMSDLALAHRGDARFEMARRALRENLEADPHNREILDALDRVTRAASGEPVLSNRMARSTMLEELVTDTDPGAVDPYAERIAQARADLDAGHADRALATLEDISRDDASFDMLDIRAEVFVAAGRHHEALADLETLRKRAGERGARVVELRATRRLAAMIAHSGKDDRRAIELFQRVLLLDPDDLGAAEACAAIFQRRREHSLYRSALTRVLEVIRRTGAGGKREAHALRELARTARSEGELDAAIEHLEEAISVDPASTEVLRELADVASSQGQHKRAAHWLESLAERLLDGEGAGSRNLLAGEICLELADIYYDQLDDIDRARDAMRRAADSFGSGARRDATLRLLASEAATAGNVDIALDALGAIAPERYSPGDRLMLAKCYQRKGLDHRAIELLETARQADTLSDEGALLLFALVRQQEQKKDLTGDEPQSDDRQGSDRQGSDQQSDEQQSDEQQGAGDHGDDQVTPAKAANFTPIEDNELSELEHGPTRLAGMPDDELPSASGTPQPASELGHSATPISVAAGDGDESSRYDRSLADALALEESGQLDGAASAFEALWSRRPGDLRPLEALERIYLRFGDAEAVSEVLGRMIVATDDSALRASMWFRRAKLYRDLLHRESEAYRCLKEAYANAPDSPRVAGSLRRIAVSRGDWGLAAELVYREVEAAEDVLERAALYNELALVYDEKLLEHEQAIRCYEQALELDPSIPAAPRPLARLYDLAGRHAEAADMFERAAELTRDPLERGATLRLAAASAERAGQGDRARRLRAQAAKLGGADPLSAAAASHGPSEEPQNRLRVLEDRISASSDRQQVAALRRQAISVASQSGNIAALERHANALFADDPGDLSAFLALKRLGQEQSNWRDVATLLQERAAAIGDPSERATLLVDLGQLQQHRLGDQDAAIMAYGEALAADENHPGAIEALADLAYQRNDWRRAADLYDRLGPETTAMAEHDLCLRRGEIAEALGDESAAFDAYDRAAQLSPRNRRTISALARTATRVGELGRAIDATSTLLELTPPEEVRAVRAARLQLAELCQRSGKFTEAIRHYENALADEPKSITALSNLHDLYRNRGDHTATARVLVALVGLTPSPIQRADLLYQLGEIYREKLDDIDRSTDAYLKAIDLDPDNLPTLRRLLDFYWKTGDRKNLLDVASDLDGKGALIDDAISRDSAAGTALVAQLYGDAGLATRLIRHLANQLAEPVANALMNECEREGLPLARNLNTALIEAARAAQVDPTPVKEELERRANQSQVARELASSWPYTRA